MQMTLNGEQTTLARTAPRERQRSSIDEHRKAIALGLHVPMKSQILEAGGKTQTKDESEGKGEGHSRQKELPRRYC